MISIYFLASARSVSLPPAFPRPFIPLMGELMSCEARGGQSVRAGRANRKGGATEAEGIDLKGVLFWGAGQGTTLALTQGAPTFPPTIDANVCTLSTHRQCPD